MADTGEFGPMDALRLLVTEPRFEVTSSATFQQRTLYMSDQERENQLVFAPLMPPSQDQGSSSSGLVIPLPYITSFVSHKPAPTLPDTAIISMEYATRNIGNTTNYENNQFLVPLPRTYVHPPEPIKGRQLYGAAAIARQIKDGFMLQEHGIPKLLEAIDVKLIGAKGGYKTNVLKSFAVALGIPANVSKQVLEESIRNRKLATGTVVFQQPQQYFTNLMP